MASDARALLVVGWLLVSACAAAAGTRTVVHVLDFLEGKKATPLGRAAADRLAQALAASGTLDVRRGPDATRTAIRIEGEITAHDVEPNRVPSYTSIAQPFLRSHGRDDRQAPIHATDEPDYTATLDGRVRVIDRSGKTIREIPLSGHALTLDPRLDDFAGLAERPGRSDPVWRDLLESVVSDRRASAVPAILDVFAPPAPPASAVRLQFRSGR